MIERPPKAYPTAAGPSTYEGIDRQEASSLLISPVATYQHDDGLHFNPGSRDRETGIESVANLNQTPLSPGPHWGTHPQNSFPWSPTHRTSNAQESLPRGSIARSSVAQENDYHTDTPHSPRTVHSIPAQRQATNVLSPTSTNNPFDTLSRAPNHPELQANAPSEHSQTKIEPTETITQIRKSHCNPIRFLSLQTFRRKHYRYVLPCFMLCILAALLAFIILYVKAKKDLTNTKDIIESILLYSSAQPITDSPISAALIILGSSLSTNPTGDTSAYLVYIGPKNSICVREKSNGSWLDTVKCLTNLNAKPSTPLAILDWWGGPSIYFITTSNTISGIDMSPQNSTWRLSNIASAQNRITVHDSSQLSAVTWLNGTSSWLYYQDSTEQLREYGIDDYRNFYWRDGATGPLGLAQAGSSIGTARYLLSGSEVLEVFIQPTNNAIHGRAYIDGAWQADFYNVDGTTTGLSANAALTSSVVNQETGSEVLLAWASSSGFLNIQTRATANTTQFNAFSAPRQLVEGDGHTQPGLASVGAGTVPEIYFASNETIVEISGTTGSEVTAMNQSTINVTSL